MEIYIMYSDTALKILQNYFKAISARIVSVIRELVF